MAFEEEYKKFISSQEWKKLRNRFIDSNYDTDRFASCDNPENCYRCDCCGWNFPKSEIQVHHKHYHKAFGKETRKDVMVLCKQCHEKQDSIRFKKGRERSESAFNDAVYMRRFTGWLLKKYGEDYINFYIDDDYEHELFQQFLKRINDY